MGRQEDKLSRPHWHSGTITASRPAESSALPRGSALSWGGPQMARPTSVWLATPELWVTRCQLIRSAIMFYFGARETAENQENYKTLQCYFAKNINCKVGFVLFFFSLTNCPSDGLGFFNVLKIKLKKKKNPGYRSQIRANCPRAYLGLDPVKTSLVVQLFGGGWLPLRAC